MCNSYIQTSDIDRIVERIRNGEEAIVNKGQLLQDLRSQRLEEFVMRVFALSASRSANDLHHMTIIGILIGLELAKLGKTLEGELKEPEIYDEIPF
jgi:hypothetical protein